MTRGILTLSVATTPQNVTDTIAPRPWICKLNSAVGIESRTAPINYTLSLDTEVEQE